MTVISSSLLSVLLLWFVAVSAKTYYATPTCPEEGVSCMTLSQYATQPNNCFTSNTTLILLPGNYSLDSELMIRNITHLTISASIPDTTVTCSQSAGFMFEGIHHVTISVVTFVGCVNNTISSVDHLTVENCNFDGQYCEGTGLELESVSNATILNSSFTHNNGRKMVYDPLLEENVIGGGAIAVNNSRVFMAHCVFSGNKVNSEFYDATLLEGGAVYVMNSDVSIDDCEFINNIADVGGAVFVKVDATIVNVSLTIRMTSFINNTAADYGGAVMVYGVVSTTVTIDTSIFMNNEADLGGAAVLIYSDSTSVTIDDSRFINNTAFYGGGAVKVYGDGSSVAIDNSTFINNLAGDDGGVVEVYGDSSGVIIDNSIFINNTAGDGGGAVEAYGDSTSITINSSTFINNTSGYGGAVEVYGEHGTVVTINSSIFINNTSGYGGAVEVYGIYSSGVVIDNSTFINNTADHNGGAVTVYGSSAGVTIDNSTFVNNTADHNGSAVWVSGNSTRVTMDNNTFINNTAGVIGGAVMVYGTITRVTIDDSAFFNNTADHYGGAVSFCGDSTNVTIDNSTFINNTSGDDGGAVEVHSHNTSATIDNSTFFKYTAGIDCGSVMVYDDRTSVTIDNSRFINNTAHHNGGAVWVYGDNAIVTMDNSTCINNTAGAFGGAVLVFGCSTSVTVNNSAFVNNTSGDDGGAVEVNGGSTCNITIDTSTFINNTAGAGGAVWVYSSSTSVTIDNSTFINNIATRDGGALLLWVNGVTTSVSIHKSIFIKNSADRDGGAVCAYGDTVGDVVLVTANLTDITLTHNSATRGAAIYLKNCDLSSYGYLIIHSNVASSGVVYAVYSTVSFSGVTNVSNNFGSVFAFNSNVTLAGNTSFMNNSYLNSSQSGIQEGGAITIFQSNFYSYDTVNIQYNEAKNGGGILAIESKMYMFGNLTIADNRALQSGGGIYAFQTELNNMEYNVTISGNEADKKGGGMYAISSTIKVFKYTLHFNHNHADEREGGVCLELNAKLYIIKSQCETHLYLCNQNPNTWPRIVFTDNSADYGGAVYVNDDTNSGTCSATPSTTLSATSECFFQVLALYNFGPYKDDFINNVKKDFNLINLHLAADNKARVAGGTLFGGLLDRCAVSPFAEVFLKYNDLFPCSSVNVKSYLLNVTNLKESNLTFSKISSDPVRVCFCKGDHPDCSYQPPTKHVLKGGLFTVSVVAVDQINNTVLNTTIHSSLLSGDGRLSEGQDLQQTNNSCTEVQYNAFSPRESETLLLYAEGPCNDTGISAQYIDVHFIPCKCPIGFKPANKRTECDCECDPALSPYITTLNCFIYNQTVLREGDFWITYVNDSDEGFLIHPPCPFDYCHQPSKQVYINFNIPNGPDTQCAFNRSGTLCGSCSENLSLSLGSSQCMSCSNDWIALLIPFAIAGIALVAFLMVFNLTVAVGTINGLIFYANVIAANSSIFLPFDRPNFLTVFIAWLNLDFGFETCFYDGMDGYAKVWLQLVFPCYIILLVAMVIVMCEYSHRFTRLLSYTNPVATLATLILLSYAKLLRTIIAALSFTTLEYPDGSHTTVWLYDANIPYLEGKHTPLFITAVLILVIGLVYTFLLMFWQLLLWVSDKQQMKWLSCNEIAIIRRWYVGLQHFIDMYQAPYNSRYRYWTGLLLLLRGFLYLISAVNVLGDPSINLLSIICVVVLLLLFVHRVYKTEYLCNIDTLFLANLIIFTAGTSYLRESSSGNQAALAYTSTSIAFITFLGILCYHTKGAPRNLYELVKKKIHHETHHLSVRAEECGTVEERIELIPSSPTYSVTSFDGLPDRDNRDSCQDNDQGEDDDDDLCNDLSTELIS